MIRIKKCRQSKPQRRPISYGRPTSTLEFRAQEKFRQVISEEVFKSENA